MNIRIREIDMYYETYGHPQAEPLVLLHGFTATGHETFGQFLDRLSRDYWLLVPDLRGHGRTTNPGEGIHHMDLARDTAAFAAAIGITRAHFCGHSSGGMHLLFLAREHPELVHSLALVSATYTFDDHVKTQARLIRESASSDWLERLRRLHGETHGPGYAETILDLWLHSVHQPDELPFTPDDLADIACPTLVLHGDRDVFFPLRVPVAMYQAIPNAQLCILPCCGHSVPFDSPAMFEMALREFLSRNPMAGTHKRLETPSAPSGRA